jgi:hypothetical protein
LKPRCPTEKSLPQKISPDAAIRSDKKRLSDYIDFIKKYRATMPSFKSGEDNETFSNNLCALEDLYNLHESFNARQPRKKLLQPMPGPVIVLKAMRFEMQALDCLLLCKREEEVNKKMTTTRKTTTLLPPLPHRPKKKIVVSVPVLLLLLDATALAKVTTR